VTARNRHWHGAAAGKVKVRSVPVPAVLAAHEEAAGEPGEVVRVVGVVRVVYSTRPYRDAQ